VFTTADREDLRTGDRLARRPAEVASAGGEPVRESPLLERAAVRRALLESDLGALDRLAARAPTATICGTPSRAA